jgi:hypothetical protein
VKIDAGGNVPEIEELKTKREEMYNYESNNLFIHR